jgi:hypothetical protein
MLIFYCLRVNIYILCICDWNSMYLNFRRYPK